jgi:hypothetical protein
MWHVHVHEHVCVLPVRVPQCVACAYCLRVLPAHVPGVLISCVEVGAGRDLYLRR